MGFAGQEGERDLKRAHDLVAASVAAAIEAAGGVDQVVDQVVAALALAAMAPSAAVRALEAQADNVRRLRQAGSRWRW